MFSGFCCQPGSAFLAFRLSDIDRRGIQGVFEMERVVFLDHLDPSPAVFGDLVDVRPFHQPQADIGVAQAVGRPAVAFAVESSASLPPEPF